MEYDNTNRGVLFKQQNKTNEKAPDYTGTFNHNGEEFKIAGWIKMSKAGNPFLSLSKDDFVPQAKEEKQQSNNISEEDIPF